MTIRTPRSIGSNRRPIFDAANNETHAVIIRNVAALLYGIAFIAGAVWASRIELADILWSHPWWTILGGLIFLLLFPLVTYAGVVMLLAAKMGYPGCLLGAVMMLALFFARAITYGYIVGYFKYGRHGQIERWKKGDGTVDPFYKGLIGGSPSKKTGFWSLPIKVGSSSGAGGGTSKGGGRFGGGGAHGKY